MTLLTLAFLVSCSTTPNAPSTATNLIATPESATRFRQQGVNLASSPTIQAEDGTFTDTNTANGSGYAEKQPQTADSGGTFTIVGGIGGNLANGTPNTLTVKVNPSAAVEHELTTYYSNGGSTDTRFDMQVRQAPQTLSFPFEAGSWDTPNTNPTVATVWLSQGDNILQLDTPSVATEPDLDYFELQRSGGTAVRLEAEGNSLPISASNPNGTFFGAQVVTGTGFSGGKGIGYIQANPSTSYVRVKTTTTQAGLYTLRVKYVNRSPTRTMRLTVTNAFTEFYSPTGGWSKLAPQRTRIYLTTGENEVVFGNPTSVGFGPDLDRFVIEQSLTPSSRDKFVWPFAASSTWNLPLAKNPALTTTGIRNFNGEVSLEPEFMFNYQNVTGFETKKFFRAELDFAIRCSRVDSLVLTGPTEFPAGSGLPYNSHGRSNQDYPQVQGYKVNGKVTVLSDNLVPSGNGIPYQRGSLQATRRTLQLPVGFKSNRSNENDAFGILYPNDTVAQGAYFTRCSDKPDVYGIAAPDVSVKAGLETFSDNNNASKTLDVTLYGGHGASRLSSFGGAIRAGELNSPSDFAIRHVMKVNVGAAYWLAQVSNSSNCFSWPAISCDSYAVGYYGNASDRTENPNAAMKMGTLLVLPSNETPESLGIVTAPGRKLFYAFQDYGAIVVDDAFCSCFNLAMEVGVQANGEKSLTVANQVAALNSTWTTFTPDSNNQIKTRFAGTFRDDVIRIAKRLYVATGNQVNTPGGKTRPSSYATPDQDRRRPFAPGFSN